jgi:hypothetical protein
MLRDTRQCRPERAGREPMSWARFGQVAGGFLVVLVAAFSSYADDQPALRVATFQSEVTPPVGHWLYRQPLKTVETPLLAKGIVLEDGQVRYVLCAVDWCTMRNETHDTFRNKLAAAVQTEPSRVAVHCVHQHTALSADAGGQRLLNEYEKPPQRIDLAFLDQVTDRLAAAAEAALARLEPFDSVGLGEAKVERVASSRRIEMSDGSFRWRMSRAADPALRALPEGRIDPMLKTVTLARGDTPLVRLHYYATHPQSFYGDGRASMDTAGFARERLQGEEDVFQIYFTGAAGDVAMGKYNDGSREARDELTERLHAGLKAAAAATRYVAAEQIGWRTVPLALSVRDVPSYDVDRNLATAADPAATDDDRARAASRVACARRLEEPIELSSLSVGPVRIVHLPGEPMVEFQLYAQQLLPEHFVAVAGYGQGDPGYICTAAAFDEGGYEPGVSLSGPEAEEIVKAALRGLLAPD